MVNRVTEAARLRQRTRQGLAIQRQAERQLTTQKQLLEEARKLEEQKAQVVQGSREPSLTERAFEQIIRAAQGKRTLVTKELVSEYQRLLSENPELKRAVNRGVGARAAASASGFSSTEEFLGVSGFFFDRPQAIKQPTDEQVTKQAQDLLKINKALGGTATLEQIESNIRSLAAGRLPPPTRDIGITTLRQDLATGRLDTSQLKQTPVEIAGTKIDF